MATQLSLKPLGTLYSDTWRLYKKHMNALALVGVIPLIFAGARMVLQPGFAMSYGFPLWLTMVLLTAAAVFALLAVIFELVMPLALAQAIDEGHRGKNPDASLVYKKAFVNSLQYVFILLLVVIVVLGGSILFIIPGIIAAIYLKFSVFTYLFEDKRGMDALVSSAWYVRGLWWALLGRQVLLAIVLGFIGLVFMIILGAVALILGFGTAVFSMIFQLFVFMILIPYAMVYLYVLYKDARALKDGKEPDKAFVNESEQLFIILLIVAAVATLIFFFISTFSVWGVGIRAGYSGNRYMGNASGYGTSGYSHYPQRYLNFNNSNSSNY